MEYYANEVIYLSTKMQQNAWAQKAGLQIFHRDQINVEEIIGWAIKCPPKGCHCIYFKIMWDMLPILKGRMDLPLLEGVHGRCVVGNHETVNVNATLLITLISSHLDGICIKSTVSAMFQWSGRRQYSTLLLKTQQRKS